MSDPIVVIGWISFSCAALPAAIFILNLRDYRPPVQLDSRTPTRTPSVSVLIPARNEERSIADCVEAALASRDVDLEVLVLDDRSEDQTAAIVERIAQQDARVKLHHAPVLPVDWCGKQHACWILASLADHERLVFLDADVRLEPNALSRMISHADKTEIQLLSGFPREETVTFAEKLVIPLIHFVLLGFLLIGLSRRFRGPAWAAGCGQFFLTTKAAYQESGGHAAIRNSRHDGVTLPRLYRSAGLRSDIVDLTGLARCRMYRSANEVWNGFVKNATEGLAAPALILPSTALFVMGHVLPPILLLSAVLHSHLSVAVLASAATLLSLLPRLIAIRKFEQSALGAVLHPLGVLFFLAIQWTAITQKFFGIATTWKGRPCTAGAATSPLLQMGCTRPHQS